jgi:hypothetical protein
VSTSNDGSPHDLPPDPVSAADRVNEMIDRYLDAAATALGDAVLLERLQVWVREVVNTSRDVPAEVIVNIIIKSVVPAIHAGAIYFVEQIQKAKG